MEAPKLLLIDDDQDTLRVLARILSGEGYRTRSAANSEDAMRLLEEEQFDAILCDVWMPGLNGIEFYFYVKRSQPKYRGRFIIVTGDVASQYTWDFIEERRLPYILKPFNIPLVKQTLAEVLGQSVPSELPPDPSVEKRRKKRTALKASVRIRRKKFDPGEPDIATTVNFSQTGLLFITDQNYRPGTDVWVVFPYSKGVEVAEQDGYVVRVEKREGGKQAVAVATGESAEMCRQAAQTVERRSRMVQPLMAFCEDDNQAAPNNSHAETLELKSELAREREEMRQLAEDLADIRDNLRTVTAERDRLATDEKLAASRLNELITAKSAVSQTLESLRSEMEGLESQMAVHEQYRYQATHDALTGLWNRAAIFDILHRELVRAKRENAEVGIIMADLDHFKRVNDTFGHLAGDAVLKEAARRFAAAVRDYDSVGRYGGEEFLLILPGCKAETAVLQAERIRAAVSAAPVVAEEGEIAVTVSLGVTSSANPDSIETALRAADAALYKAKQRGRNRVLAAERPGAQRSSDSEEAPAPAACVSPDAGHSSAGEPRTTGGQRHNRARGAHSENGGG